MIPTVVFVLFCLLLFLALHLSLTGNSGRLTWVKLQQLQEQRYPFLAMLAVFSFVQRKVWLPRLRIVNPHTDVNAFFVFAFCFWLCDLLIL